MDESNETPELYTTDPEMRQLLGLFDVPAFARRGQELEFALERLDARCRREREAMLDMVRLRVRQWASLSTGTDDFAPLDRDPSSLSALEASPLPWASSAGSARRRMNAARELIASVDRFNRRWSKFVLDLNLGPINRLIDHYNAHYVFEKECVFRSSRVASRGFRPRTQVTPEGLLDAHPCLPALALRPPS